MTMRLLIALICGGLLVTACARKTWVEGGLYAAPQDDGTFAVLKVLKLDDGGVHVRLYSNRFSARPASLDEKALFMAGMNREAGESLGMGHAPLSTRTFSSWNAVFIQQSSVSDEELDGYRMWQEAKGGYF